MKKVLVPVALAILVVVGCNTQKNNPDGKDKKFTFAEPAKNVEISPNTEKEVVVGITRKNFDEPVTLTVDKLPEGVHLVGDKEVKIEKGKSEVTLKLKADENAKEGKGTMTVMASGGGTSETQKYNVEVKGGTPHTTLRPLSAEDLKKAREKLSASVSKQMDEIKTSMDDLRARAKTAEGKNKEEINREIDTLEKQRQDLSKRFGQVQETTADRWEQFSTDLNRAAGDLSQGARKALDRFKK